MITEATLIYTHQVFGRQYRLRREDGWSFSVQSGVLAARYGDDTYSVPLSSVAFMRGCPAAPPKKAVKE